MAIGPVSTKHNFNEPIIIASPASGFRFRIIYVSMGKDGLYNVIPYKYGIEKKMVGCFTVL